MFQRDQMNRTIPIYGLYSFIFLIWSEIGHRFRSQIEYVFSGHTVAIVTFFVTKMKTMCSPLIGQFSGTMIVASSDKVWLY